MLLQDPAPIFARHKRVAFQFSGGRDSLAALFALEPFWNRMHVYHLNHGDQYPETAAIVDMVSARVPIWVVHSDSLKIRTECGLPSDLLPADNTGMGRALTGRGVAIQGRFECCARVIMEPLHRRMLEDRITLIVRGVRADDFAHRHEFMSGHVSDGIELYYPIEDWSAQMVNGYLEGRGLPVTRFYREGLRETPECMGCTAWWDAGHLAYLHKFYPARHESVRRNIALIRAEVDRQYAQLKEADHG